MRLKQEFPAVYANVPGNYVMNYAIRMYVPSNPWPVFWDFSNFQMIATPSGMNANRWCLVVGTPYTGQITLRGNKWGPNPVPVPDGSGLTTMAIVHGDPLLTATLASQAIGTLAAGANWSTSLTMRGAVVGDVFDVQSAVAGGLVGLDVKAWATADNSVTVRITNTSASAVTAGTQTLTIAGRKLL